MKNIKFLGCSTRALIGGVHVEISVSTPRPISNPAFVPYVGIHEIQQGTEAEAEEPAQSGEVELDDSDWTNCREFLAHYIGQELVDITQSDDEDLAKGNNFLYLHFANGKTLTFPVDEDHPFTYDEAS